MAEQNISVQLGCGTLIVIAIIVMMFSGGRSDKEVKKQLRELNQKVERLEKKIDTLNQRLAQPQAAPSTPAVSR